MVHFEHCKEGISHVKCSFLALQKKGGESMRKLLEVMVMHISLIVMMVSKVYEYAQTHQIIYIKHMKFFISILS